MPWNKHQHNYRTNCIMSQAIGFSIKYSKGFKWVTTTMLIITTQNSSPLNNGAWKTWCYSSGYRNNGI